MGGRQRLRILVRPAQTLQGGQELDPRRRELHHLSLLLLLLLSSSTSTPGFTRAIYSVLYRSLYNVVFSFFPDS